MKNRLQPNLRIHFWASMKISNGLAHHSRWMDWLTLNSLPEILSTHHRFPTPSWTCSLNPIKIETPSPPIGPRKGVSKVSPGIVQKRSCIDNVEHFIHFNLFPTASTRFRFLGYDLDDSIFFSYDRNDLTKVMTTTNDPFDLRTSQWKMRKYEWHLHKDFDLVALVWRSCPPTTCTLSWNPSWIQLKDGLIDVYGLFALLVGCCPSLLTISLLCWRGDAWPIFNRLHLWQSLDDWSMAKVSLSDSFTLWIISFTHHLFPYFPTPKYQFQKQQKKVKTLKTQKTSISTLFCILTMEYSTWIIPSFLPCNLIPSISSMFFYSTTSLQSFLYFSTSPIHIIPQHHTTHFPCLLARLGWLATYHERTPNYGPQWPDDDDWLDVPNDRQCEMTWYLLVFIRFI